MKIPSHLRIDGKLWKVILDKDLYRREKLYGLCSFQGRKIFIDTGRQSKTEQKITLLHEILHALWPDKVRAEEMVIRSIEGELYNVLVRYLFKKRAK